MIARTDPPTPAARRSDSGALLVPAAGPSTSTLVAAGLQVQPNAAGLLVCGWFDNPAVDDVDFAARAAEVGVAVDPISTRFISAAARPGLAMGFRRLPAERVPEAVRRLITVLTGYR